MQMLAAGGIELVTDGNREADESNPKGYHEDDRVKKLLQTKDRSWLEAEHGKAIKIVAPLLRAIPAELPVKIIFAERDSAEVIASQRKMLEREHKGGARTDDYALGRTFAAQLKAAQTWADSRDNVELLPVSYAQAVSEPATAAAAIAEFLGRTLDQSAMATATDASLYRTGRTAD
jgi:hypothetical protein